MPDQPAISQCRCYVRYLGEEAQFTLRWGAHNPACPVYRRSLDPVDHHADVAFREAAEMGPVQVVSALATAGYIRRELGRESMGRQS